MSNRTLTVSGKGSLNTVGSTIDVASLSILVPKLDKSVRSSWESFFPYYAGFSEKFASSLLKSAKLPFRSVILDPWNGSGTTTYAAADLGLPSLGFDLNPAMVIVAKARLLPSSEVDSVLALGREIVARVAKDTATSEPDDPLRSWFAESSASTLRSLERTVNRFLINKATESYRNSLDKISPIAAAFYVALFSLCRELTAKFRSSNPSWLRRDEGEKSKVRLRKHTLLRMFTQRLHELGSTLTSPSRSCTPDFGSSKIRTMNTSEMDLDGAIVDFILTSPPYCTRLDYTAATRAELALLAPLLPIDPRDLARSMIGSTRVPLKKIVPSEDWGDTCNSFLREVRSHYSKASSGYYYFTHLDYFDKVYKSLCNLERCLKKNGTFVIVVQDSYYKDIHNNLAEIVAEMASTKSLALRRREDFCSLRSMSSINSRARIYRRNRDAVESVLCFQRAHS